jgi:hypothetical protein
MSLSKSEGKWDCNGDAHTHLLTDPTPAKKIMCANCGAQLDNKVDLIWHQVN